MFVESYVVTCFSGQESASDKYGFAQANGRVEFEMRQGKSNKQILEGPNMFLGFACLQQDIFDVILHPPTFTKGRFFLWPYL